LVKPLQIPPLGDFRNEKTAEKVFLPQEGPCNKRVCVLGYEESQGVIAQLGERYNGIVEVGGSIPPGSTNFSSTIFSPAFSITEAVAGIF